LQLAINEGLRRRQEMAHIHGDRLLTGIRICVHASVSDRLTVCSDALCPRLPFIPVFERLTEKIRYTTLRDLPQPGMHHEILFPIFELLLRSGGRPFTKTLDGLSKQLHVDRGRLGAK
jgi:hypothetical protein